MSNILKHFSGIPREVQKDVLLKIEKELPNYDVFVISAPTGAGKSGLAMTLASYHFTTDVLTPTNLLVEQYTRDYPAFPKLLKKSLYPCCREAKYRRHPACERQKDLRRVFGMRRGIQNLYMYMSTFTRGRKPGDWLVIDEAHNLVPTLQSMMAKKLWRHDWFWPKDIETGKELGDWAQGLLYKRPDDQMLKFIVSECFSQSPSYVFEKSVQPFGKKQIPSDVILIKPVDVSRGPTYFTGKHLDKIFLMSATISRKDIESLGLDKRRVLYLECDSPIPVDRRPIEYRPVTSVTKNTLEESAKEIAAYIEKELLDKHEGEKGVVHATYEMAELISRHTTSNRFLFHDNLNKASRYREFLTSSPESGKVLVASGLYQGMDLPGDLGRWQVLAKVPWLNLGDRATKYKAEHDQDYYLWETLKDVIQASGRVSRGPTDYGITYVLDGTFKRLIEGADDMVPNWFSKAITWKADL